MKLRTVDPNIQDEIGFTKIMLDDVIILEDVGAPTYSSPANTGETNNMLFWLDGIATSYILEVWISNFVGTNEWDGAGAKSVTLNVEFDVSGYTTS